VKPRLLLRLVASAVLPLLLPVLRLPAQAASSAKQAAPALTPAVQVMILGVFHFANPNADYAKFEGIDVLTPVRQSEIETTVAQLARFAPTKIALERVPAEADSINADYRRYRGGTFVLSRNEIHQLGFRLAARLHHTQLYPVDFQRGMRIDSVMAYAQVHDTAFVTRFNSTVADVVQLLDRMQREATIGANLRFMNDPKNILRAHQPYADMATVGAGDSYIGARVVTDWYGRNLGIFANLARIVQPGDRVLLIIGMGHTPILRELVRSHPGMLLVDALDYLQ
jgi:Family of unknown function (DUF5694)